MDSPLNVAPASPSAITSLLDLLPDATLIVNSASQIVAANDLIEDVFQLPKRTVVGQLVDALLPHRFRHGHQEKVKGYFRAPSARPMGQAMSLYGLRQDGTEIPLDIAMKPFHWEGESYVLTTIRDISARLEAEDQLRFLAQHDVLTGLGNRAMLTARLEQLIHGSDEAIAARHGMIFLDLDRFKLVNDSLGHDFGDLLLQSVAQRLTTFFHGAPSRRRDSSTTLVRLGGDEFVIILNIDGDARAASRIALELRHTLSMPHRIAGHAIAMSPSIGVLPSLGSYSRAEDALRDADIAMYQAKQAGGNGVSAFDENTRRGIVDRLRLENDLRSAMEAGQLSLAYQPIVDLESGMVRGFEALARWTHPRRGAISPLQFIPIAEETGLIIPMGQWAIRAACEQAMRWQPLNLGPENLYVTVNLSKRNLLHSELVANTRAAMRDFGLSAGQLKSEVTESVVVGAADCVIPRMNSLREGGVGICMDDFGTGESSLAFLHQFPIDVLKIDRSFVANVERGRQYPAILHAIITLAHNLNMTVIAEGLETPEQIAQLQALECDSGQGYAFAEPMACEDVMPYLESCETKKTAMRKSA